MVARPLCALGHPSFLGFSLLPPGVPPVHREVWPAGSAPFWSPCSQRQVLGTPDQVAYGLGFVCLVATGGMDIDSLLSSFIVKFLILR